MHENLIPKAYLTELIAQAKEAECDVVQLLNQADIDLHELKEKDSVSSRKYGELYRLIMRATQNEWFGMFSNGRVPLGAFRLMGLAMLQCDNLEQAILRGSDFADICRGMTHRYFIESEATVARITMVPIRSVSKLVFNQRLDKATPEILMTSLLSWNRLQGWLIDREIPIIKITLKTPPRELKLPLAYGEIPEVEFNAPAVSMSFSAAFLDQPIVQDQNALTSFLRAAPYHIVTPDFAQISPAEKVRAIINRDVSRTMPSAEQVASQLNVSVTTLRRLLQKEGTSFQKLKDETRKNAAFHYLETAELSNADVASRLGFDEPSAFFRSFKKWTGMTPGEYRQSLK